MIKIEYREDGSKNKRGEFGCNCLIEIRGSGDVISSQIYDMLCKIREQLPREVFDVTMMRFVEDDIKRAAEELANSTTARVATMTSVNIKNIKTSDCPICGRTIPAFQYVSFPEQFVATKTRRHTTVIAHKSCLQNTRGDSKK